ncbi:MAG TPA: bifunctional hydroxymethylpyrimidine kinase/phosphomethylpyrimidine kinase [Kiritimatiellia bacterium]|nr:bifunctional hydroxymethylpyrimidine kinase/phosphomethylpyrimidine kinase [Kiritimatiellia bacterium]HMO99399.1 bifunctional hydroxymethylpyrimidine kinase/phosphomethylpyrimidine kinase [Kiritimatiellia bacterium]HMP97610.1 bifunctional hydroxymethylpyrimidine kinase/phosphomethylpyrimidine kinase [Kiritimatiellia bacterium]
MQYIRKTLPVVLTIAGSDSSGGAGIQADLKTFSALNVYGASALTCITAQNPGRVSGIAAVAADMVSKQIQAVCDAFPVAAAKTGMLYSADIIRAVAEADVRQGIPILVVDPVMVAVSGARLLQADAVSALCDDLLPQARVITPNLHEAEILIGHSISNVDELRRAAHEIGDKFDVACVAKGGNLGGDDVVDVLYDEGDEFLFKGPRIHAAQSHGAGCSFSAALTAYLGKGLMIQEATERAKQFVSDALQYGLQIGEHRPLNFFHGVTLP